MRGRRSLIYALLAVVVIGALSAGMAFAAKSRQTAKVTVTETEYKLTFSSKKLSPGTTTFVVVNKGKIAHSLAVSGPGIKKAQLKTTLKPHGTASLTVTLKDGSYTFWCPVPGHAGLGMKTTFAVGSGSAGATASTGGSSSGGSSGSSGDSSGGWG
jgi:plastocyanin